jgi:hypothetical protein
MGNEQVEQAIAIVIDPGAAGAEADARMQQAGFFRDIGKAALAVVVEQNVLAPAGNKNVVEAVVIVIADGNAEGPEAGTAEAGLCGNVLKSTVAIVGLEAVGGIGRGGCGAALAGQDDDIHPAVVIVVDESGAAAHGFEDVVDTAFVAKDDGGVETGGLRHFREFRVVGEAGCGAASHGLDSLRGYGPVLRGQRRIQGGECQGGLQ